MVGVGRLEILRLYKNMLRESQKFSSYNYRHYAIRRVRDAFKESKSIDNPVRIAELVDKAKSNLAVIQRQVIIGQLYAADKLIIEQ